MSSLARRTLRTTAAAAGMAALGVGLAGNALAAPRRSRRDDPDPAPAPNPTSALPALPALPGASPLTTLPDVAQGKSLPMLFVFQGPKIHTAGPSGSAVPAAPVRTQPAAPVQATAATPLTPAPNAPAAVGPQAAADPIAAAARFDRVGALSALDSAAMFDDTLVRSAAVDQRGLGTSNLGLNGLG